MCAIDSAHQEGIFAKACEDGEGKVAMAMDGT
jgi:hypothetical protein